MSVTDKLLALMPAAVLENPDLRADLRNFGTCYARFTADEHGVVTVERVDPYDVHIEPPLEPDDSIAYGTVKIGGAGVFAPNIITGKES